MSSPAPSARLRARHRRHVSTKRRGLIATIVVGVIGLGTLLTVPAAVAESTSNHGIFSDNLRPAVAVDPDRVPVELGVRFSPHKSGEVTAIQYYQGSSRTGVTSATLWSRSGRVLAQTTFTPSHARGWRTVELSTPVRLHADDTYVVSYHAPDGAYPVTENDLTRQRSQNGFSLAANAGVYAYGKTAFPTSTYKGSNYLVDVVYDDETVSNPSQNASPTPTVTPSANPSPTSAPKPISTPTSKPSPTSSLKPTSHPKPSSSPITSASPSPSPSRPAGDVAAPGDPGDAGWTVSTATVGLKPLGLTCSSLPAYKGGSDVPAGTTLDRVRITSPLDLSAGDITIQRSCIQPTTAWRGLPILSTTDNSTGRIAQKKVTIRDSEFDGSKLDAYNAAFSTAFIGIADLSSNYIHGFGSGIGLMNTGSNLDATISRNYVTGLVAYGEGASGGNHSDAFTVRDFSAASRSARHLNIINNRFDCASGNDTGALFIQTYSGRIDNVLIEGNLLEGQGYQLGVNKLNSSYSNLRAINNRFTGTGWGPTYVQGGNGWSQWTDNFIYSAAATNAAGRTIPVP